MGDLYLRRRNRNFEEILEIEVTKETLVQSQNSIEQTIKKFSEDFELQNNTSSTKINTETSHTKS